MEHFKKIYDKELSKIDGGSLDKLKQIISKPAAADLCKWCGRGQAADHAGCLMQTTTGHLFPR